MSIYATDTHALIYFANRNHRLLSPRARDVFEQAETPRSSRSRAIT